MPELFKRNKEKKKQSEVWKQVDHRVKALDQRTIKQYITVFIFCLMVLVIVVFFIKRFLFS